MHSITIRTTTVTAVCDDLTTMEIDAIVNAANEDLEHGGGLAGAISRAGGPSIQAESHHWVAEHGRVTPGRAAVTTGGNLPARKVIHVAGPIFGAEQDNEALLATAVRAALDAAIEAGCRRVAVPAISAGIFGYPLADSTRVIAATVIDWVGEHSGLDEVHLVGFDEAAGSAFESGLEAAAT